MRKKKVKQEIVLDHDTLARGAVWLWALCGLSKSDCGRVLQLAADSVDEVFAAYANQKFRRNEVLDRMLMETTK